MLSLASSLGVRLLFERGSLFTHCAHICCEICTEKSFCIAEQSFFLHFFKHIYSIVKSLKHGAICNSKWVAQKSPILQKVSHPLVWFWCAGGSRQLVYALNFLFCFFLPEQRENANLTLRLFRWWQMIAWRRKEQKSEQRQRDVTDLLRREVLISVPLSLPVRKHSTVSALADLWKWEQARNTLKFALKVCPWFGGVKRYRSTKRLSKKHNKTKKKNLLHPPASANTPPSV